MFPDAISPSHHCQQCPSYHTDVPSLADTTNWTINLYELKQLQRTGWVHQIWVLHSGHLHFQHLTQRTQQQSDHSHKKYLGRKQAQVYDVRWVERLTGVPEVSRAEVLSLVWLTVPPWGWSWSVPLKHRALSELHGVTHTRLRCSELLLWGLRIQCCRSPAH